MGAWFAEPPVFAALGGGVVPDAAVAAGGRGRSGKLKRGPCGEAAHVATQCSWANMAVGRTDKATSNLQVK